MTERKLHSERRGGPEYAYNLPMGNWQEEIARVRRATGIRCRLLEKNTSDVDTVAREFGLQPSGRLEPVDGLTATAVLEALLWKDMAYQYEIMPRDRARELAREFVGTFPVGARFFVNARWDLRGSAPFSWSSCTSATFDGGVIAIASDKKGGQWLAGCIWLEDED